MMMPANFSAVAENEMTYVVGGASLVDYLAPAMEAAQWKNFSKNMITIIGNTYLDAFVSNTVGTLFSGTWKPGKGIEAFGSQNWKIWEANGAGENWKSGLKGAGNIALNVLGNMAAIYNLGFGTTKNDVEKVIKVTSIAL